MNIQPEISAMERRSESIIAPPMTAKTDSKLIIIAAAAGEVYFCPII